MFKVTGGAHFTVSWPGRATQGKVGRRERIKSKERREKEDAGREWRMKTAQLIQNGLGPERRTFITTPCRSGARGHLGLGLAGATRVYAKISAGTRRRGTAGSIHREQTPNLIPKM
jgi:hypothetical protein